MKKVGMLIIVLSAILLFGACVGSEEFARDEDDNVLLTVSQLVNLLGKGEISRAEFTSEAYSLSSIEAELITSSHWVETAKGSDFRFANTYMNSADVFGFNAASVVVSGHFSDGAVFTVMQREHSDNVALVHAREEGFLFVPEWTLDVHHLLARYEGDPWNIYVKRSFAKTPLGELDLGAQGESPKRGESIVVPLRQVTIEGSGFDTDDKTSGENLLP